jgi:hypothetical protein
MTQTTKIPSLEDCILWLDNLEEGATIWDTELPIIYRAKFYLQQLSDEMDVANEAHARFKAAHDSGETP